jgi:hypothetical protein
VINYVHSKSLYHRNVSVSIVALLRKRNNVALHRNVCFNCCVCFNCYIQTDTHTFAFIYKICMYICMCVWARAHVRTHVRTHACRYVRTYVCMYVRTYVCMYACFKQVISVAVLIQKREIHQTLQIIRYFHVSEWIGFRNQASAVFLHCVLSPNGLYIGCVWECLVWKTFSYKWNENTRLNIQIELNRIK